MMAAAHGADALGVDVAPNAIDRRPAGRPPTAAARPGSRSATCWTCGRWA